MEIEKSISEFEFLKNYEGKYKIDKNGNIYSCIQKKIMKPQMCKSKYKYILLVKDGKIIKHYIHRLLALQFIENKYNKLEVDHIDRNKINNDLSNLRWATRIENRQNREDYIPNMTKEQLEKRKEKYRLYKREWIKNKRLSIRLNKDKQIDLIQ